MRDGRLSCDDDARGAPSTTATPRRGLSQIAPVPARMFERFMRPRRKSFPNQGTSVPGRPVHRKLKSRPQVDAWPLRQIGTVRASLSVLANQTAWYRSSVEPKPSYSKSKQCSPDSLMYSGILRTAESGRVLAGLAVLLVLDRDVLAGHLSEYRAQSQHATQRVQIKTRCLLPSALSPVPFDIQGTHLLVPGTDLVRHGLRFGMGLVAAHFLGEELD